MLPPLIRIRNGYRDQLPHGLASLSEDPRYHDTVLICQDGILGASRFILALALPMLKRPLRGREEEEVVILMPSFATHEVKHAMGLVFLASGITYENREIKAHPEEPVNNSTQYESKKEEEDFKAKEEEYLQVKHEVGSEEDMFMDDQDDSWDFDDERPENVKKVRRSPKKKNKVKYEIYSEDELDFLCDLDDEWERGGSERAGNTSKVAKKSKIKREPADGEFNNFDCYICEEAFTSKAEYKQHESEKHVDLNGMIACPIPECGKKFKVTDSRYGQSKLVKRHIMMHKGKQESSYVCPECGKTFKNRGSLGPHMALHTGIKNIHCDECDQSFFTTSALLGHKMRTHDENQEVICPECGKRCSNKYTLKRHMIRHTGERPYKCEFEGCGKSFFDSQVLKNHERIHLDLKEFQCSLCPKAFRQSYALVIHMKRHNGVRIILLRIILIPKLTSSVLDQGAQLHRVWKSLC